MAELLLANGTSAGRLDDDGVVWRGRLGTERYVGRVTPEGEIFVRDGIGETKIGSLARDGEVRLQRPGQRSEVVAVLRDNQLRDLRDALIARALTRREAAAIALLRTDRTPIEKVRSPNPKGSPAILASLIGGGVAVAARWISGRRRDAPPSTWWETREGVFENANVPPEYRREIPSDVRARLRELRELGDPNDIDDEDAGLAFQYMVQLVDAEDLDELIRQRTRLNAAVRRGVFKP